MFSRLDWKCRYWVQEVLNWAGERSGITLKGVMRNLAILHFAIFLNDIWSHKSWDGATIAVFIIAAIITVVICYIMITIPDGTMARAEVMWNGGRYFRLLNFIFFPLAIASLIFNFGTESVVSLIGFVGDFLMWYVSACINPPPKKRREQKRLVPKLA